MRDAHNQKDLLSAVERACGLTVRIISGEEEAVYAFQGVTSDPLLSQELFLLLDVGGGSTEFILGQRAQKRVALSFPLGTVRLLEELRPSDPPSREQLVECRAWLRRFLVDQIDPKLTLGLRGDSGLPTLPESLQLVATGGTASILACMEAGLNTFDRARLEATRLSRDHLHWHVDHIWRLPLAERQTIIGLPPNRADVILTGTAIYEAVMDHFDFQQLRVSTRGLRFGVVMDES